MEAVIYWNLVDGYAAFAPQGDMKCGENIYYGGLMHFDMTEKPSYKMLKKLIHEDWHTSETVSAKNGARRLPRLLRRLQAHRPRGRQDHSG